MNGKPRVLLIDDSRYVRLQVMELLTQAGCQVTTANDGREGLSAVSRDDPDVVLLDVEMPVMNGYEALAALNAGPRLYSIILFTCLTGTERVAEGLNEGADDYVTKPFAPEELIARVRAAARTTDLKKNLAQAKADAEEALRKFHEAQARLIEEQRLASLARLSAGLVQRINAPLGRVTGACGVMRRHVNALLEGIDRLFALSASPLPKERIRDEMLLWMREAGLDAIRRDIQPLMSETLEGLDRISLLVRSLLKVDEVGSSAESMVQDINQITERLKDRFSLSLPSGVTCAANLSAEPLLLSCNAEQISLSLYNILDNARDAVGERGEIALRVFRDEDWACVEVRDTGKGLCSTAHGAAAGMFFAAGDSDNKAGLGLAIAQCLAQVHGGGMEVRPEENAGTRVVVRLPLAE